MDSLESQGVSSVCTFITVCLCHLVQRLFIQYLRLTLSLKEMLKEKFSLVVTVVSNRTEMFSSCTAVINSKSAK